MLTRSKLLLAALTAALTLGALLSTAYARRITVSNQNFRATWTTLRFLGGVFGNIECPVTIEGSFHSRTISKVLEALVGYVSRAVVAETRCAGGSARVLAETLPWHIRYNGFSGTLPNITQIHLRIVGAGFLVQIGGTRCRYKSTETSPMRGWVNREAGGIATSIRVDETAAIPKSSGSFVCPGTGRLEGTTNSLTLQGSTTRITVTLVA
jgi:hypothetical protein